MRTIRETSQESVGGEEKRRALVMRLKKKGAEADLALVRMLWVGEDRQLKTADARIGEANRIAKRAIRQAKNVLNGAEIESRRRFVVFTFAMQGGLPLRVLMKYFEAAYETDENRFCSASSLIGMFANHLKTQRPSRVRAGIVQRLLELSESGKRSRKADATWFEDASRALKAMLKKRTD